MNPLLFALLEDAPPAQGQSLLGGMVLPLILCFGVFYFLILRPEQKARKKRQEMLSALGKGDKVVTTGGLYGSVVQIQDDVVTLQVDEGVRLRFARSAIQSIESATSEKAVEVKAKNA